MDNDNCEKTLENGEKVYKRIASIDVGMVNMGIVIVEINRDWNWKHIIHLERVSLVGCLHRRVSKSECKLHETKNISDYIDHFHQEFKPLLDSVDHILIERQPPMGMVHIEQLLLKQYRSKATLISPTSMQKYFKFGKLDYDQRKARMTEMANQWFKGNKLWEKYENERCHDISDAAGMCIYFCDQQRKSEKKLAKIKRQMDSLPLCLEQFRYQVKRTRSSFLKI